MKTNLVTNLENPAETFVANGDLPGRAMKAPLRWHTSVTHALERGHPKADTIVLTYFPEVSEHVELLSHARGGELRNMVFRRASRSHAFYFTNDAHGWLDAYAALSINVYWHDESTNELFVHAYRGDQGFFIREELVQEFNAASILAFYGSAVSIDDRESKRISALVDRVAAFIGPKFGVLTGGGPGVMRLAMERAHAHDALTGSCFLELEAQPTVRGVDFFNTFRETSRHNRQKWFRAADLCVFNVGGIGTLEEVGIELCNLKLGIRPRVPYIFYNTGFWRHLKAQLGEMVETNRAPAWLLEYVLFTDDPDEVVGFYQKFLGVSPTLPPAA